MNGRLVPQWNPVKISCALQSVLRQAGQVHHGQIWRIDRRGSHYALNSMSQNLPERAGGALCG